MTSRVPEHLLVSDVRQVSTYCFKIKWLKAPCSRLVTTLNGEADNIDWFLGTRRKVQTWCGLGVSFPITKSQNARPRRHLSAMAKM